MDGTDKASLELDGVTLLERALEATSAWDEVVVVGTEVSTGRAVRWTREDPPAGGPAAGILAALERFGSPPDLVAVLAVDMPRTTSATFARLEAALTPAYDGALLVDKDGRRQPLCAVYRYAALQQARPRDRHDERGLPVHRLIDRLRLVEVDALGAEAVDVDTWEALHGLQRDRPPE